MSFRNITESENRLLLALLDAVPACQSKTSSGAIVLVEPLDDGGMGSLRLTDRQAAAFPAAEVQFQDSDGVVVIATLYVDRENVPLEIGVWKVDFSPLIQVPSELPPANRL